MRYYSYVDSPVGRLLLAGDERALSLLSFQAGYTRVEPDPEMRERDEPFAAVVEQLEAYFAGELQSFEVELAPRGTDFQRRVWDQLCKIPYGETISYGELARRVGNRNASRAVGAANGANPIAIVIPCHRVIGSNGSLTGFGGGLPTKKRLLGLEQRSRQGTLL